MATCPTTGTPDAPEIERDKMSDFKKRLADEVLELADRLRKLEGFIGSDAFLGLDEEQKTLLYLQEDSMRSYRRILSRRIALIR